MPPASQSSRWLFAAQAGEGCGIPQGSGTNSYTFNRSTCGIGDNGYNIPNAAHAATGAFLDAKRNVIFIGGTGTGKTHLCIGVASAVKRCHLGPASLSSMWHLPTPDASWSSPP